MTKGNNFWVGMLVGVAAGAATALLTAPKRGAELRDDIGQGAHAVGRKAGAAWGDMKDKASDIAGSAKTRAEKMADRGKDVAMSAKDRVQEAMSAGRQAAEEKKHEMTAEFEAEKRKRAA